MKHSIFKLGKVRYVIVATEPRNGVAPDANFQGTGKALCGILKPKETLRQFIHRKNSQ